MEEAVQKRPRRGPVIHLPYPRRDSYIYEDIDKDYRNALLMGFQRNLGDSADMYAEDFTQEVLLRALVTIDRIDPEYIHVYLARLSANLLIDHSRSKQFGLDMRRHDATLLDEDGDPNDFLNMVMYEEVYDYLDPETVVHHNERYDFLQKRLLQFSSADQFIIKEYFDRGEPLKEVAEWLGITYANARQKVVRIRAKLRDYFEEEKKEFLE